MADDKNINGAVDQEQQGQEATESTGQAREKAPDAKTFTQDEVNSIVQERVNRAMQKAEEKAKADREEAEKLAKMNAQQRAEHENAKLKEELAELRKANTLSQMAKTARGMLEEKGVTVSDDLVQMLITEEAESTKKNVDTFADMYAKAVEDGVNAKLKGRTPGRMASTGMSKGDILAIKDTGERQRAIAEHLELFNQ